MPNLGRLNIAGEQSREGERKEDNLRGHLLRKGLSTVIQRLSSGRDSPLVRNELERQEPLESLFPQRLKNHEIRLIHLEPRTTSEGHVKCSLVVENLDEVRGQYEALSYEWGSISPKHSITLDGNDTLVRENLGCALQHLQLENETRVLWIDALCINQDNTVERNHQVALMSKIYSSATRCIAWIGPERIIRNRLNIQADDCELAIEFIKKTHGRKAIEEDWNGLSPHRKSELDSLECLCRRRYWSRLWIIQEIYLSASVVIQCGPHKVPWSALCSLFDDLKTFIHPSYQFSISRSTPFRLYQQQCARNYESRPLLKDVALLFNTSQCEDPRDRLFGLLSLARSCCGAAVPADYSKTARTICMDLLTHNIVYHVDWSKKSHDLTTDIQELCDMIMFKSEKIPVSRQNDTSIASASMKAVAMGTGQQTKRAGKVIWIMSAIMLEDASRKLWAVNRRYSDDLLEVFVRKVCWRGAPHALYYQEAQHWQSPPRPTHIFLTDLGFSGITLSEVKLGHYGYKESDVSCEIWFRDGFDILPLSPITESFHPSSLWDRRGISLHPETTFQELLSWVLEVRDWVPNTSQGL